MGLCNTPGTFQTVINDIFDDFLDAFLDIYYIYYTYYIYYIYLADMLIYSKDEESQ